jgi:methyltransferase (TIGR00027 family)
MGTCCSDAAGHEFQNSVSGCKKDGTAQGVARLRHFESMLPKECRLFEDPYAHHFYRFSWVFKMLGPKTISSLYSRLPIDGALEAGALRTKWIDDSVMQAVGADVKQMVVIGAGYDTRGLRLTLPADFHTFEVDQPIVQQRKICILHSSSCPELGQQKHRLHFVPLDLSVSCISELFKTEGYKADVPTIFIMEGLSYYIEKSATQATLEKLRDLAAPGSTIVISYLWQPVWDEPEKYCIRNPGLIDFLETMIKKAGEPFVSKFHEEEIRNLLEELHWKVESDVTYHQLHDKYLVPLGRQKEADVFYLERIVSAALI